jgi:hypothetical protein
LLTTLQRLLTATPAVEGTWVRESPIRIVDSYLGTLISDEPTAHGAHVTNIVFKKMFELNGIGEFELAFLDHADLNDTVLLARSVVAGLPKKDYWYRLLLAWHHRDEHRLMSRDPILSVRKLASRIELCRIFIWSDDLRAELWYSAGGLFGGAQVCLVLDGQRRYINAAMG